MGCYSYVPGSVGCASFRRSSAFLPLLLLLLLMVVVVVSNQKRLGRQCIFIFINF